MSYFSPKHSQVFFCLVDGVWFHLFQASNCCECWMGAENGGKEAAEELLKGYKVLSLQLTGAAQAMLYDVSLVGKTSAGGKNAILYIEGGKNYLIQRVYIKYKYRTQQHA